MKIRNKILSSLAAAFVTVFCIFGGLSWAAPGSPLAPSEIKACAANSGSSLGKAYYYYHKVDADKDGRYDSVRIAGCDNFVMSLAIPKTIDGLPVTAINDGAFYNCMWLSSVSLPDTVTYIGSSAFNSCMSLKSINIPQSVKYIGSGAFKNCMCLSSVTLPSGVASVSSEAFSGCVCLKNVVVGSNVQSIESSAFSGCVMLKTLSVPAKLRNVGRSAFMGCYMLSDVYYGGTSSQWNGIKIEYYNSPLYYANIHYTEPAVTVPAVTTTAAVTAPAVKTTKTTASPAVTTTTVRVITTTTAATVISRDNPEFEWDKDNWNFDNNKNYFKNTSYYINDKDLSTLRKNVTNKEWYTIMNFRSSTKWNGSCYGMSSLALLAKNGYLSYSDYKQGADSLYKLDSPSRNSNIESLVNYYFMLQFRDEVQQQVVKASYRSAANNIKDIISSLNKYPEVLVGYEQKQWGGHAVIAYDYEYGNWKINGNDYQGKIYIYDPNFSRTYNDDACVYFNTSNYHWIIPAYDKVDSYKGAAFNMVISSAAMLNNGGFLAGKTENMSSDDSYIASLKVASSTDDITVSKIGMERGVSANRNGSGNDIIAKEFYDFSGESEGTDGYILNDAESGYKVSRESADEFDMTMDYENCVIDVNADKASEVVFDPSGYAEITGADTGYELSMAFNEGCHPTDWYEINVSGRDADNVCVMQTEEGYIIRSDDLSNVNVKASNHEDSAERSFSTSYKSVLVCEIDENKMGIYVDTDNNGTYETAIEDAADIIEAIEAIIGDANGDGRVDVRDAAVIAVKIAQGLSEELGISADVNGDGKISIRDAAALAKMLSSLTYK